MEISELNPVNIDIADVGNNTILDMKLSSDLNNRKRPPFLVSIELFFLTLNKTVKIIFEGSGIKVSNLPVEFEK